MKLPILKRKIRNSIEKLYKKDIFLIDNKLCERCIVHRLAFYLEQEKFAGYFVDVEYNKSHLIEINTLKTHSNVINKMYSVNKKVSSIHGNYIDIIITKRTGRPKDDLICFEVKRWDNYNRRGKDRENLEILTLQDRFAYKYGFYIILGKNKNSTKIEIYRKGRKVYDSKFEDF